MIVILVICLVAFIVNNEKEDELLVASPRTGDIYEVRHHYHDYTLYKVKEIIDDTVYVFVHKQFTNIMSSLHSLKMQGDHYYLKEPIPILKSELKRKFDSGLIIEIDRP